MPYEELTIDNSALDSSNILKSEKYDIQVVDVAEDDYNTGDVLTFDATTNTYKKGAFSEAVKAVVIDKAHAIDGHEVKTQALVRGSVDGNMLKDKDGNELKAQGDDVKGAVTASAKDNSIIVRFD